MAGDIDGLADEEEAGHVTRFHRARVESGCIDTAGSDFGLFEAFGAGGVKLPAVQAALAGFECGIGPGCGCGGERELVGKALGQRIPKSLAKRGSIAAARRLEQRRQELDSWSE